MLLSILNSWTVAKTACAAHPDMLEEDQQQILDWILQHKGVTITKFAQVQTKP